jgi:hypothetical protein
MEGINILIMGHVYGLGEGGRGGGGGGWTLVKN